jgi:NAD(P)-dependent dehydrogenase (short-subunit alcohol dehydrogenase family)/pimeloyl-ACP methyl ester carboxylesterase
MIDGATKRTVPGDGVELSLVEAGDPARPTVVFIHGYPDTKELWEPVMELLANRFHVVAYDVRGAGESSRPRGPAAYDYDRLAGDLEAVIREVAPGRAVHLVGHDWGGIAGWQFATTQRFEGKLVSFTTIAGPSLDQIAGTLRQTLRDRRIGALIDLVRRSWYVTVLCTPGGPTAAWRGVLGGRRWPWFLAKVERVPTGAGYPAQTLAADGASGSNLYRRNIPRRLLAPRRDAVAHVPVQLILPTGDHFISTHYYDGATSGAPRLRRRLVAGSHWSPRAQPALIARWIGELVDQVETGTPQTSRRPWIRGGGVEQLKGRLALVTGAGSGIGRATALALGARGARLLLVDRDGDAVARVARSVDGARAFTCDVSDPDAMERLANAVIGEHGVPDIVVNNAGIAIAGPFLDTEFSDWRQILDINVMGVVHGSRLFARAMIDRGEGGQIVNTASAAAFQPQKGLPAYSASKAAVLMLSECLRAEVLPYGIGVTAVCPGVIATNITRATRYVGVDEDEQQRLRDYVTRVYQRRNFTPRQVAEEIVAAIAADKPVAVVTPEAKVAHALSRFAPGLARRLAGVDALPV